MLSVDCKVDEWTAWDRCSVTCGGANTRRTRSVLQQPEFGGAACPALEETTVCNPVKCAGTRSMSSYSCFASQLKASLMTLDFQFPANLVSGQLGVPATWIAVMETKRERELPFKNQNMEEQPVHLWRKQRPAALPVAVASIILILHSALQSLFSVVVSLRVTSATSLEVLPNSYVTVNFAPGRRGAQSSETDDQGEASFKLRWG